MTRIAVGSDHAGYSLKSELTSYLSALGHEVIDYGTNSTHRVDYPDFGFIVGRSVTEGEADLGLCVCGSGIGIAIAANKIPGVRAATVWDVTSAQLARKHNDANVICFGERLIGVEIAKEALSAFIASTFEGGRHSARVEKIDGLLQQESTRHDMATRSQQKGTKG